VPEVSEGQVAMLTTTTTAFTAAVALVMPLIYAEAACRCASPDPCFDSAPWFGLESDGLLAVNATKIPAAKLLSVIGEDDPLWLSNQPTGTHHSGTMGSPTMPGWATANSTASKYIELHDAKQAARAVKFAAEHNLQVTVKNTGHDWFGRSVFPGSLELWTHRLNSTQWHESFIPKGCDIQVPTTAVTLGAGVQFWQIVEEMAQHKRLVMTGTCLTVGHVGFSLGGGYGDHSRMYGSGATNMLEAEVVLADGELVTANECGSYSDLFRALRGGGGAFALVTSITYRTYPEPRIGHAFGTMHDPLAALQQFLEWYSGIVQKGLAKHWGGTVEVYPDRMNFLLKYVNLSEQECSTMVTGTGMLCSTENMEDYQSDTISSPNGAPGLEPEWELTSASSYHIASATRYFKLENIETEAQREVLAKALMTAADQASAVTDRGASVVISLNYALGHGSEVALEHHSETTVHPQVADALGTVKLDWTEVLETIDYVPDSSCQVDQEKWANFETARAAIDEALPGSGSYYNEGDYTDTLWQDRYWGSNYAELLATKKKYDPEGMFSCHQCVGSASGQCHRRLQATGPVFV